MVPAASSRLRPSLGLPCLAALIAAVAAPAQAAATDALQTARAHAADGRWPESLTVLLDLPLGGLDAPQREALDALLGDLGRNLEREGRPELALQAYERSLAAKALRGDPSDRVDTALRLQDVSFCLVALEQLDVALERQQQAVGMLQRLHAGGDHADLASGLHNLGFCLDLLGRTDAALAPLREALAMRERLFGGDHPAVADSLQALAQCELLAGDVPTATALAERALAMRRRLHGDTPDRSTAACLDLLGACCEHQGRPREALVHMQDALALLRRLGDECDELELAASMANVAAALSRHGRGNEALPLLREVLAVRQRLLGSGDEPLVADAHAGLGACFASLGRPEQALAEYQRALAMVRRLAGGDGAAEVMVLLHNIGECLLALGRADEAVQQIEAALVSERRRVGDRGSAAVVVCLTSLATCELALGSNVRALALAEEALALCRRSAHGDDDERLARCLSIVGTCRHRLDRHAEALAAHAEALGIWRRTYGDQDHPDVAMCLNNQAACFGGLQRDAEALSSYREALAIVARLHEGLDHPFVAICMQNVGATQLRLGEAEAALAQCEAALRMHWTVRGGADHVEVARCLQNVADCQRALGRLDQAFATCERSVAMLERLRERGRVAGEQRQALFDELKHAGGFEQLQQLAVATGRNAEAWFAAERGRARGLLDRFEQQGFDPIAVAQARLRDRGDHAAETRLGTLLAEQATVDAAVDGTLHELATLAEAAWSADERAAVRADLLARLQQLAAQRRRLGDERARLLGDAAAVGRILPAAEVRTSLRPDELLLSYTLDQEASYAYLLDPEGAVATFALPHAVAALARLLPALVGHAARDPGLAARGRDPAATGERTAMAAERDPEAAARELFAALVPPALWARLQPARCVFVVGHRELHRLPLELLVVATEADRAVRWLDRGPPVAYVPSGSVLHWLRRRPRTEPPAAARLLAIGDPTLRLSGGEPGRGGRSGGIEALGRLRQLGGARAEAAAIGAAFTAAGRPATVLLGDAATEPVVTAAAPAAQFLHFACHGIADEVAEQSFSMLVLARTERVTAGDDGLLQLGDLWNGWQGRLAASRLVVLSACHTNVGPTNRDDAPQALPLGFLGAGAPAVVSSLWAVDDASTRELMVDFYGRLLAGGADQLQAFTQARQALRAKYPDPYHWAPFRYVGCPE
ncbi:MAG: CHAT domain-containing protein [Planctomycetes bacterium]|nr:CHAT domain-containing protein [Planctomycetota bacterium]